MTWSSLNLIQLFKHEPNSELEYKSVHPLWCLQGKCCKTSSTASPTSHGALYFAEHFLPRANSKCGPKWLRCFWQWRWAPQNWRKALPFTPCWVLRRLHKILVLFSYCKRARSVCILLSERLFVAFNNTLYFSKNMVKIRILLPGFFFFSFFCLPCKWWRLRLK